MNTTAGVSGSSFNQVNQWSLFAVAETSRSSFNQVNRWSKFECWFTCRGLFAALPEEVINHLPVSGILRDESLRNELPLAGNH